MKRNKGGDRDTWKKYKASSEGLTEKEAENLTELVNRNASGGKHTNEEHCIKFDLLRTQSRFRISEMHRQERGLQKELSLVNVASTEKFCKDWTSGTTSSPSASNYFHSLVDFNKGQSTNQPLINYFGNWKQLEDSLQNLLLAQPQASTTQINNCLASNQIFPLMVPKKPIIRAQDLSPPVERIVVDELVRASASTWQSDLESECYKNSIVIIKGLVEKVDMNLDCFFSRKVLDKFGDKAEIETRLQQFQPPDKNFDAKGKGQSWELKSYEKIVNLKKFVTYQEKTLAAFKVLSGDQTPSEITSQHFESVKSALKEGTLAEELSKNIRGLTGVKIIFGTNIDISEENIWKEQNEEFEKLPDFMRYNSSDSLFNYMDCHVLGMNSIELYFKVPGCRTVGHQENNNFVSININAGPGTCEWFSVRHEYWGAIQDLCIKHKLAFLGGKWWPDISECKKAGIPVTKFIQNPGEIVFVNIGNVHWVQSISWSTNIAWNCGKFSSDQYKSSLERYVWNNHAKYMNLVPMAQLSFNFAEKNQFIKDFKLLN